MVPLVVNVGMFCSHIGLLWSFAMVTRSHDKDNQSERTILILAEKAGALEWLLMLECYCCHVGFVCSVVMVTRSHDQDNQSEWSI